MAKSGGVWELHGLTSWGVACRSLPGVYATVQRKCVGQPHRVELQSSMACCGMPRYLLNSKIKMVSDVRGWITQNIGSECQRAG